MMHLYFLIDGDVYAQQEYVNRLSSFYYKVKDPQGKDDYKRLCVSFPRIMELRFHRQALNQVLKVVGPYTVGKYYGPQMQMLRKMLGLKPFSRQVMPDHALHPRWMMIQSIGWKPDKFTESGVEMV